MTLYRKNDYQIRNILQETISSEKRNKQVFLFRFGTG